MNSIKSVLRYVLTIHFSALLLLSVFRFILLLSNTTNLNDESVTLATITTALTKGIWFDNVIACYISILPLVVLLVLGFCKQLNKISIKIFNFYYIILFGLVFAISASDIPYFNYFFKHLNSSIFNWKEEGGSALQLVLQEPSYYIYFFIFVVILVLFSTIVIRTGRITLKQGQSKLSKKQYSVYIAISIIVIGLCLLGIRGRAGENPIKTSQAYFCNNSFLNQLGLNPTFFLLRSIIENSKKHISANHLMKDEDALSIVQNELNINCDKEAHFPILRNIDGCKENKDINIVLILMESMSAEFLSMKEGSLTPYLNELIKESYYFENFYSAGTHTNQGVVATLFGLPSLFDKNIMKNVEIAKCQGIPRILSKRGYQTSFFVTHESQYDNMNAFLLENGIQRMYAQEDYPASKVVNGYGVQDDYLFEYAMKRIIEQSKQKTPFFTTILTISNHPPYIVPEKFKLVSKEPCEQIVAFADDAIRQFMSEAKKQDWYKNTIFVLLGDHGKLVGKTTYDMPLSYNHIPLIIHSALFDDAPKVFENLGGQIDITPTLLGLLDYSFDNNTLGIDIIKQKRPYIFFTSDDMMGCINSKHFYVYNPITKNEGLYDYKSKNIINERNSYISLADSMRNYSTSMLITTDYLLKNNLTRVN
ncbi:LTA synthase family protein [Dysgonomonas sp. HGC4]|uniref:LTA synthase family protein n=1 Tax=Dysgonomonas sp. HGC4 TaxID=1658009 RepID=UPI000680C5CA|nr:alkaline phosphatase family protein [Dysgonomonas sp. HGC4]MBD8348711.1 sulfatase-like hydrolase/transferase [Dysgonomonas sp. HGC4]